MSKITGNEPIGVLRNSAGQATMVMINGEEKGFGLTIRQYYAGVAQVDANSYTMYFVSKIMGCDPPNFSTDPMGSIKYWNDFEALIKVMKADALIAALNKTTQ